MDVTEPHSLGFRNRIVMAAMTTGLASAAGRPTEALLAWYETRAAGGTGAVIVEETLVLDDERCRALRPHRLRLAADRAVTSFAALATRIAKGGAVPLLQVSYPGVSDVNAIPADELARIVAAFVAAAQRAQRAGFSGVQLQAIPSRLLGQLLTPRLNRGRDRTRTHRQIIEAIRRECGTAYPVLIKLSADERDPRGITPDLAREIARSLEAAGVGGIEVVGGAASIPPTEPLSSGVGEATRSALAAEVKAAVGVPVLASGRILSHDAANQVLGLGQADLVAVGRALLADPAWVAKQRAGIELEIAPCIGCMACFTPAPDGSVGCPVNAEAGLEHLSPLSPAARARTIAVLGASLAGLELARVAASRGHTVRIATSGMPLGGLLGLRAGVPGDAEFGRALLYFGDRLRELGVNVTDDAATHADVVIDCRPSPERRPKWVGLKGTLAAGELLGRDLHEMYGIGRRVAVVGDGAHAAEVALFLAGWGRRPSVIVSAAEDNPFFDVHPVHAARLRERLEGYKIPLVSGARALKWEYDEDRKSRLIVRRDGQREALEPFHSAVAASGWESASQWPQRWRAPRLLDSVPAGTTIRLPDTFYPEPLRDQVRFAHRLGRLV
ncbi:MAG TPA: NAD-binding protein [Chloroflexota bacterium]|nr:NAD-binding protein [Chloroflexota bacterium]